MNQPLGTTPRKYPTTAIQARAGGVYTSISIKNNALIPGCQNFSIQNLVQFDSDHVLNVEQARLYPFDTYFLSSTLRIVSPGTNQTLPIRRLATIDETSSFLVKTVDIESYSNAANNTESPSRDIDMFITRPGNARAFTLLLFGVSWILTHVTICHVIIARMLRDVKPLLKHLVSTGAILVALPQIRNSMPDAPGLDGVLIGAIICSHFVSFTS